MWHIYVVQQPGFGLARKCLIIHQSLQVSRVSSGNRVDSARRIADFYHVLHAECQL
jgi:hypothetical protein